MVPVYHVEPTKLFNTYRSKVVLLLWSYLLVIVEWLKHRPNYAFLFVIVNVTCMLLSVDQVWYPSNMLNPPNYLLQTVPRRFL